jgi:hypothetical protein
MPMMLKTLLLQQQLQVTLLLKQLLLRQLKHCLISSSKQLSILVCVLPSCCTETRMHTHTLHIVNMITQCTFFLSHSSAAETLDSGLHGLQQQQQQQQQ